MTLASVHPVLIVLIPLLDYLLRIACAIVVLLRARGPSSSRVAWLMLIFAFPLAGMVAYLALGERPLGFLRRKRANAVRLDIESHLAERPDVNEPPQLTDDRWRKIATIAGSATGNLVRAGNQLRLFGDTDQCVEAMIADIDGAQASCHLLFYIYLADRNGTRVAEALIAARDRGVKCRLLVDDVGSRRFLRSALARRLRTADVEVARALPAYLLRIPLARIDLRNHRKIAIIDGQIGYTGSQNIADADFAPKSRYAPWIDAMVRVDGPVVRDLQAIFAQDWCSDMTETPSELLDLPTRRHDAGVPVQVLPTGPTSNTVALRQLLEALCHAAQDEIVMTTPYFVPDEALLSAIRSAAAGGIRTSIVVPARNDSPLVSAASRGFYQAMLESGVTIYEHGPGLLHAKTITIDRDLAFVSTANMDRRSFELNFEVSQIIYDSDFASELRFLQQSYIEASVRVSRTAWAERGITRRLVHNTLGMLGPIL